MNVFIRVFGVGFVLHGIVMFMLRFSNAIWKVVLKLPEVATYVQMTFAIVVELLYLGLSAFGELLEVLWGKSAIFGPFQFDEFSMPQPLFF